MKPHPLLPHGGLDGPSFLDGPLNACRGWVVDAAKPGAMFRWAFYIILFVVLAWAAKYAYGWVQNERVCIQTTRCEDRLHSLETNLEIYSSNTVIDAEKAAARVSERRAYYPADLEELIKAEKGTEEYTTCPIYGVKYKYVQLDGGKSFFAYCPARHAFHFDGHPFVNAVKPDQINMHLFVEGGKVMNLVGEHPSPNATSPTRVDANPSPLDSHNPTWAIVETKLSPSMFDMLGENPTPITRW